MRGGGWSSIDAACRVAVRSYWSPSYRFDFFGVRLALSSSSREGAKQKKAPERDGKGGAR